VTLPTADSPASSPPGLPRRRRLGPLGLALDRRIQSIQKEYLRGSPGARADLAKLRRGLGKPAGTVPEIWDLTLAAVPPELTWDRDEPSRAEQASHAALTLYALHQQSMSGPAHVPGVGFGEVVGRLGRGDGPSEAAVTRRFMAVATAESVDEVLTHVRGLVTQLKRAGRGLDYAQFADDVIALLTPGRETPVRLAWGRGYYRTARDKDAEPTDSVSAVADDTNTEIEGNQP
jgi:CRISPR system Cascade subunit CasB